MTNIQALARGKATREQLQQESMPFRVERIVNAMDLDDSGTVLCVPHNLRLMDGARRRF